MKRVFVALPLTEALKHYLLNLKSECERFFQDEKWVEPDHWHLTLCFLGSLPENSLKDACKAIESCARVQKGFPMSLGGVGAFPSLSFPRVVWVGLREGERSISDSAGRLKSELEKKGFFSEARSFHAHITLARLHSPLREPWKSTFQKFAGEFQASSSVMQVTGCDLMESVLTPKGPRYTLLHRVRFENV